MSKYRNVQVPSMATETGHDEWPNPNDSDYSCSNWEKPQELAGRSLRRVRRRMREDQLRSLTINPHVTARRGSDASVPCNSDIKCYSYCNISPSISVLSDAQAERDIGRYVDELDAIHDALYGRIIVYSGIKHPWEVLDDTTGRFCDPQNNEPDSAVNIIESVHTDDLDSDGLTQRLLDSNYELNWISLRKDILNAEDVHFTLEQSKLVASRLIDIALQYRDSINSEDKPVIWSAIRTGASMLQPDQIDLLLPLLEPGHQIDTSMVTLKMIGRIFEAQPPSTINQFPPLSKKLCDIANSILNPFVIVSNQSAAMAQLAIYALAAIGSSLLPPIITRVLELRQNWFSKYTSREIRRLQSSWGELELIVSIEHRKLVDDALKQLAAQ